MPWPFTSVDALFEEISIVISDEGSESSSVQVRNAFTDPALGSMLVWEILVGGIVHVSGHLIGESIREKLEDYRGRLQRGDRNAIAEARAAVEHPMLEVHHVSNSAKAAAVEAVTLVIKDAGRSESVARAQAERIIELMIEHYRPR